MAGESGSRKTGIGRSLLAATALCGLVLAIVAAGVLAAGGGLDTGFGDAGRSSFGFGNAASDDTGKGVAVQPDGKIVLVGRSDQGLTDTDFAVARLNSGGGFDTGFSEDGRRTFGFGNGASSDQAEGVAIQSDGKIVVVGGSDQGATGTDFAIARLNPGGGRDPSFGGGDGKRTFGFGNGANGDLGLDVAIQPDGKIVVVGYSIHGTSNYDFAVARLNRGGGFDTSFSDDGRRTFGFANGTNSDVGDGVAIQPNGKIVVAGESGQTGSGSDFAVARLKPDGFLDGTFSVDGRRTFGFGNGAGGDYAYAMATQANGKIVVAGYSEQNAKGEDFAVARLNAGGGLDTSFSEDGRRTFGFANAANDDEGNGVAIQPNGKIVVSGYSVQSATGTDFAVARLNVGGGLDTGFSEDGRRIFGFANGSDIDVGNGVAIQPNGKIVVTGASVQAGMGRDFAVARLLGG